MANCSSLDLAFPDNISCTLASALSRSAAKTASEDCNLESSNVTSSTFADKSSLSWVRVEICAVNFASWALEDVMDSFNAQASSVFCLIPASRLAIVSLKLTSTFASSEASSTLSLVTRSNASMHCFSSDSKTLCFVVAVLTWDLRSLFSDFDVSRSADKVSVWPCNLTTLSCKRFKLATTSSFSVSRRATSALVCSRFDANPSFSDCKEDNTSSAFLFPDKSLDIRSFAVSRSIVSDSMNDSSFEILDF
mmetsp:Transcript_28009/g.59738  ORF Transcript_28009/g.59738 Transcript_28009/m.59738 type:complete len:250 (-) Transcript_28009:353-1102(-)